MLARVEKALTTWKSSGDFSFVHHKQYRGSMGDNLRSLIVADRPRNATVAFAVATLKQLEVNWYMAPCIRAHSPSKSP
jgi:hypothetical protein